MQYPPTYPYSPEAKFEHSNEVLMQYVVYENPLDAQGHFVIRQWTITSDGGIQSGIGFICKTREQYLSLIPFGMVKLIRSINDDPAIKEVWI